MPTILWRPSGLGRNGNERLPVESRDFGTTSEEECRFGQSRYREPTTSETKGRPLPIRKTIPAPRTKTIARANLSIYFDSLQGRIGKATFTKTRLGTIVRETVDAVQPNSPAQQAVKSRFSTTAAFWDALTDPQKQAWKTYAATLQAVEPDTKTTYKRTGYNVYSGYVNVWLAANGSGAGTPPTAPPSASYPTPAMAITAAATASTITLSSQTPTPSGTVVEVWLQRLKNASRTPAKNGYRVKTYAPLVAGKGSASLAVTVKIGRAHV